MHNRYSRNRYTNLSVGEFSQGPAPWKNTLTCRYTLLSYDPTQREEDAGKACYIITGSIMAITCHIFLVLAIFNIMLLPTTIVATQYVVGDNSGWTLDFDYQAWASTKAFKVGDALVFNYPKGIHNVFIVNNNSFANCVIPSPSKAYTSGHDVIPLLAPGKEWFICGVDDHCSEFNQKLAINVKSR
ncbi:hypothetical protein LXL04_004880 [Taraxacum kok-saghyz]